MKTIIFLFCISFTFALNAQTPMNHGRPLDKIFIGVDNQINLCSYSNCKEMTVEANSIHIDGKSPVFTVRSSKVHDGELIIKRNGIEIERYPYHSVAIKDLSVVAITEKYGLIKEGKYAKEIIANIIGLKIITEVYWAECSIQNYNFLIAKKPEIYHINILGPMLRSEQKAALRDLHSGDNVFFDEINVRTPGDDAGRGINNLVFTVK